MFNLIYNVIPPYNIYIYFVTPLWLYSMYSKKNELFIKLQFPDRQFENIILF